MAKASCDLTSLFVEAYRLSLLRGVEDLLAAGGYPLVAGVDEAGRGCLAGPVVAAAVLVDARSLHLVPGVDDSKNVPAERRPAIAELVRRSAVSSAWMAVSARTIERINILEATRMAMRQAVSALAERPDVVLVDAVPLQLDDSTIPCSSLIRGDAWSYAISCASLIAKTERDRLMEAYDLEFPVYGFGSNKGYGAPPHRRALEDFGPSPIHRLTFRSVVPRVEAPIAETRRSAGARRSTSNESASERAQSQHLIQGLA